MKMTYAEGMALAIRAALTADPNVFLIGNLFAGVSVSGRAAFAPLIQDFAARVVTAPVSEAGLAGAATGAALAGCRPLVDLGAASFTFQAWSQLVNEAPNFHYMSGGQTRVPATYYALIGIRGAGAAQHSHRTQAMLANVPGLQVLLPATPADAYHQLKWALTESQNPTIYLPHALLLEDEDEVDLAAPGLPAGQARVLRPGRDVSVLAHAVTVRLALQAAERLAEQNGVLVEVVDMRSVAPLDRATMIASVAKTGRAVVVDESHSSFGIGAELVATLAEQAFSWLKAPVLRVATPDVPIPFSPPLEMALLVTPEKIAAAVLATLGASK